MKVKIDPQLIAKARELRDRYLEQVNDRMLMAPRGKYEASRALESATRLSSPKSIRDPQSAILRLPAA